MAIAISSRPGLTVEAILALYQEKGVEFLDDLQGMFAFALYDSEQDAWLIGRDHIGIIPLYMGHDEHGNFYVASEMKALVPVCRTIKEFPAGSYLWSKDGEIRQYYQRDWFEFDAVKDNETDKTCCARRWKSPSKPPDVRRAIRRIALGRPGFLHHFRHHQEIRRTPRGRSGTFGSLVASVALLCCRSGRLPDLKAAQEVANHLGTVHHEIHFTVQEGLDAIRDVIYHIETYDVTTIRASTPMYLMSRKIKAMGIKMVLSGEGSDEVFGGYLYFHKAPNAKEFHEETVRKLLALNLFDCARANKSLAAWG